MGFQTFLFLFLTTNYYNVCIGAETTCNRFYVSWSEKNNRWTIAGGVYIESYSNRLIMNTIRSLDCSAYCKSNDSTNCILGQP